MNNNVINDILEINDYFEKTNQPSLNDELIDGSINSNPETAIKVLEIMEFHEWLTN